MNSICQYMSVFSPPLYPVVLGARIGFETTTYTAAENDTDMVILTVAVLEGSLELSVVIEFSTVDEDAVGKTIPYLRLYLCTQVPMVVIFMEDMVSKVIQAVSLILNREILLLYCACCIYTGIFVLIQVPVTIFQLQLLLPLMLREQSKALLCPLLMTAK